MMNFGLKKIRKQDFWKLVKALKSEMTTVFAGIYIHSLSMSHLSKTNRSFKIASRQHSFCFKSHDDWFAKETLLKKGKLKHDKLSSCEM